MMRKLFLLGLAMVALVSAAAAPQKATERMTQEVSVDLGQRPTSAVALTSSS